MQVYYFTRTGRSKKVAEELAERYVYISLVEYRFPVKNRPG